MLQFQRRYNKRITEQNTSKILTTNASQISVSEKIENIQVAIGIAHRIKIIAISTIVENFIFSIDFNLLKLIANSLFSFNIIFSFLIIYTKKAIVLFYSNIIPFSQVFFSSIKSVKGATINSMLKGIITKKIIKQPNSKEIKANASLTFSRNKHGIIQMPTGIAHIRKTIAASVIVKNFIFSLDFSLLKLIANILFSFNIIAFSL